MAFPSVDEDGLPTDRTNKEKIKLEYFFTCFHKWNNATDEVDEMDYTEEIERLKEEMMENQDVNIDYLKELETAMLRFKREVEALSNEGSSFEALEEQSRGSQWSTQIGCVCEKLSERIVEFSRSASTVRGSGVHHCLKARTSEERREKQG